MVISGVTVIVISGVMVIWNIYIIITIWNDDKHKNVIPIDKGDPANLALNITCIYKSYINMYGYFASTMN